MLLIVTETVKYCVSAPLKTSHPPAMNKTMFFIKDFNSNCEQIRGKMRIW